MMRSAAGLDDGLFFSAPTFHVCALQVATALEELGTMEEWLKKFTGQLEVRRGVCVRARVTCTAGCSHADRCGIRTLLPAPGCRHSSDRAAEQRNAAADREPKAAAHVARVALGTTGTPAVKGIALAADHGAVRIDGQAALAIPPASMQVLTALSGLETPEAIRAASDASALLERAIQQARNCGRTCCSSELRQFIGMRMEGRAMLLRK